MFLGLRTAIYPAADLAAAKKWYSDVLGKPPYFDEPFYVGFEVGGYELGLVPAEADSEPLTYWGVGDADKALAYLLERGAELRSPVEEVGDGIRVAAVRDPSGHPFGIIENPVFKLPDNAPAPDGPGR